MSARARSPRAARLLGMLDDLAHQRRGVLDVGLGPLALGRVGVGAGADRHEPVVDQVARSPAS